MRSGTRRNQAATVAAANQLVATKLSGPSPQGDVIARPRLIQLLEQAVRLKLTLVSTPPGYGKSTLVAQWRAATTVPVCWISLDEEDNDAFVFLRYLLGALESIDPHIVQATSDLMQRSDVPFARQIAGSLINDLSAATRPFAIVLEDFHVITSLEILDLMRFLLQNLPHNMHLIIVCRQDPQLPLVQMSARGELLELRTAQLRFTGAETRAFLVDRHRLALTQREIEVIDSWAEGWPVGLRLIANALQGANRAQIRELLSRLSDHAPLIDEYLWEEVVRRQEPDRQRFLMQTSLLNQFTPDACEAVTGIATSGEILQSISRDNLFLDRIEIRGHWYRYHHLFAEFLRDRLNRELPASEVSALHIRAAIWYEQAGLIADAARHAIRAADWERAASLLVGICAELFESERLGTLKSWLDGIPNQVYELEPDLAYWHAWALLRAGHLVQAGHVAQLGARNPHGGTSAPKQLMMFEGVMGRDAATAKSIAREILADPAGFTTIERCRSAIMLAILLQGEGDMAGAEEQLGVALVLAEQAGNRGLHLATMATYGWTLLETGRLAEASTILREVIARGDEWNDLPVQHASYRLALIEIERYQIADATVLVNSCLELAERMDAVIHVVHCHHALSLLAWARKDWSEAFGLVDRAIELCNLSGYSRYLTVLVQLKCRLWLATDQLSLARGWARQTGFEDCDLPEPDRTREYLAYIRVRIRENELAQVLDGVKSVQIEEERRGRRAHLLDSLLAETIALECGERFAEADESMLRALETGAPEGYIMTFVQEGPGIVRPLERVAGTHPEYHDYVNAILDAMGVVLSTESGSRAVPASVLSTRELEVLRLVAAGQSNRNIGETLFISEETVKTHLRRIFEKLSVSSRTQAVDRGRQLGLF